MRHQAVLHRGLVRVLPQRQKIKEIRGFRDALGQIGLGGRQGCLEICDRLALPPVQAGLNLERQHVARPAVLHRFAGIPEAVGGRGEFVKQGQVMIPR